MIELSSVLMNALATEEKSSTNYIIASYVMNHINDLKKNNNHLTTGYLAKQCNVSKASISRFCRDVGFEDFYTFKYMIKNYYPHNTLSKKYSFINNSSTVYDDFMRELTVSLDSFKMKYDQKVLDQLIEDLHTYKNIVMMGHQQSFAMALTLQNDLGSAFCKYAHVCGEPAMQAKYFEKATSDDLFVVFSATGKFFNNTLIKQKLHRKENEPRIYLITINPDVNFSFVYQTICLANGYNYPSMILMYIYIGLIASTYQLMNDK